MENRSHDIETPARSFAPASSCSGRNHGRVKFELRTTNFLYLDGHVEGKNIRDTLGPKFERGADFYSLSPRDVLQ